MTTMPDSKASNENRRVFISTTTRDLAPYRKVANEVINAVSANFDGRFTLTPVSMDNRGQDGDPTTPLDVSRAWVRDKSDWVVLILAWNYGYVPPGADCSVTESEYRIAIELGKKCFVFLAGELSDPLEIRYRALESEPVNLTDFRGQITDPQHQRLLDEFKARLRANRFDLFKNIEDFRTKLDRSLNQCVISELFGTMFSTIGPDIGRLELLEPLQICLDEVKLLAQLKRLHDTLHRIRQFGIRTWREELVAAWPDDGGGKPPVEAREMYLERAPDIARLVERVGNNARDLPAQIRKTLVLDKVVSYEPPKIRECSKEDFIESTEGFASRVQRLFTRCETEMGRSASRLNLRYGDLADSTRRALEKTRVEPNQERILRDELDRSAKIHSRLQKVMENHRSWQLVHDDFERIESDIPHGSPNEYDSAHAARQRAFLNAVSDLVESDGAQVRALLEAADEILTQDGEAGPSKWRGLIEDVGRYLELFIQTPDVELFSAMRKHFDDLFFQIDLVTLSVVESSENRVRAIEAGLQARPA